MHNVKGIEKGLKLHLFPQPWHAPPTSPVRKLLGCLSKQRCNIRLDFTCDDFNFNAHLFSCHKTASLWENHFFPHCKYICLFDILIQLRPTLSPSLTLASWGRDQMSQPSGLALVLRILEVLSSNISPGMSYPCWGVSWFSSFLPCKCQDCA